MKPRVHSHPFIGGLFCAMLSAGSLLADEEKLALERPSVDSPSETPAVRQARALVRQSFAYHSPKNEAPVAVTRSPQPRLAPGWDIVPEKPASLARQEPDTDPNVVKLDPLVVQEQGFREADQQRALIEERRERTLRELQYVEDSVLDDILNPTRFSLLGPYSKRNRIYVAQGQLNRLELEQKLVSIIDASTDASERDALRRYLLEVRYGRRMER